jgi:hypothetical protein
MKAQQNLDTAAELVGGDRAKQHGDARRLHEQVARPPRRAAGGGTPPTPPTCWRCSRF